MPRVAAALYLFIIMLTAVPMAVAEEFFPSPDIGMSQTRIEADDEAGVIRFYVKGSLAAILDETGLHVLESIEYGGTITDTGTAHFDTQYTTEAGDKTVAE